MLEALVIGAGVTGLSAAYALGKQGVETVVVDPQTPGGVVRTTVRDGFVLEQGPNVFIEKPELRTLLDEVGLRDEVRYPLFPDYRQYLWSGGRPQAVPKGPGALLASPLFTTGEKVRLVVNLFRKGVLRPHGSDESLLEFIGRLAGPRVVEEVLDPVLKGIYGGDVARLSARSIFGGLWESAVRGGSVMEYLRTKREGPRPKIFTLARGAASLVEALVERSSGATFVRDRVVEAAPRTEGGGFTIRLAGGSVLEARKLYLCTSGAQTSRYIERWLPSVAGSLEAVRYASLAVVHCAVPSSAPLPEKGFGVLFSGRDPSRLLGVMCNSRLFSGKAPSGRELLTVCLGGVDSLAICERSDDALAETVREELRAKLRLTEVEPLLVTRWPQAIPQLEVGHYRLVDELRQAERRFEGLRFLGVDNGGVGVPDRVKLGLDV